MTSTYQKSELPRGLRLVTEYVPGAASVSLGLWAAAGSRDELDDENGLAHMLEHMVFKGTASRDKLEVARLIDRLGGLANAFTTKEHTCFHTRVRPEHLRTAVDLLLDIIQGSVFDIDEFLLEKQVIQQEIAMVEDEPEELVHDLASASFWPNHPLGRPVAGTRPGVEALSRQQLVNWRGRHYVGSRLVVSAAGAVDHQRLADFLGQRFELPAQAFPRRLSPPENRPGLTVRPRKLEQAHLLLTFPFPDALDPRRHAAAVLNLTLGGNMSSRLFQEIREKRGLAYSVYSGYTAYHDAGALEIYAGASPESIAETSELVLKELERLRSTAFSAAERDEAVEALTTGLILGGESLDSRMSRLGKNELVYGRVLPLEEICGHLESVKTGDLQDLALEFLGPEKMGACILGPVDESIFGGM